MTPAPGQSAEQMAADIAACRARLLAQPGSLDGKGGVTTVPSSPAGTAVAGGAGALSLRLGIAEQYERESRYTGSLRERGYGAEQRPMR